MRIAIATTGRFHVLDLARELEQLGHEVTFYSALSRRRSAKFGLSKKAHNTALVWLIPIIVIQRTVGRRLGRVLDHLVISLADRIISKKLKRCDVFIGMSSLCIRSAQAAREKYRAIVYIERGSRHIQSQKGILDALRDRGIPAASVPTYSVNRELRSYEVADKITVASRHVERSFTDKGIDSAKLFRNPYGVQLNMFPPTSVEDTRTPTIVFVGGWTYRKGVDILVDAWKELKGVKLIHVGGIGDAPLPREENFQHYDPVPQWQLTTLYAQAHVFVLASREEGLALVQAQALASGLPVVCTDRTGGEDLKELIDDPSWITVVPHDDPHALSTGISEMIPRALSLKNPRDLLGSARNQLSWQAYGSRYEAELSSMRKGSR